MLYEAIRAGNKKQKKMKKILLSITAFSILCIVSCKKSDNNSATNPTGPTLPKNYWKIDTSVYTPSIANYIDGALQAFASNSFTNDCIFDFNSASLPAAGTYKIVNFTNNPGEVSINASTAKDGHLVSIGTDNAKAIVTVNAGKLTIAVSGAILVDEFNNDTVKISTNLIQTQ